MTNWRNCEQWPIVQKLQGFILCLSLVIVLGLGFLSKHYVLWQEDFGPHSQEEIAYGKHLQKGEDLQAMWGRK